MRMKLKKINLNMNLTFKTIAYFLLVVIVTSVGFSYIIWKVDDAAKISTTISSDVLPLFLKTTTVNNNASNKVAALRGYFMTNDIQFLADYKKVTTQNSMLEEELVNASITEDEKRLSTELKALDDKYTQIAEKKFLPLVQAGKSGEAISVMRKELAPIQKDLNFKFAEHQYLRNKQITNLLIEAKDKVNSARNVAITAAIIAGLLGMIIGFLSARSIARPVNQLTSIAQKVASGDLTEQIKIDRQDEIGQLATTFNTMVIHLKSLIKQININSEQVAASAEELTASSEQSAQAANHIASSIAEVANGATEHLAAVNETSAVVEEMSAGIQQVAANTNHIAEQSARTAEKAKEGGKSLDKAITQMNAIEESVEAVAKTITKLNEKSKEIDQILDTITAIAGQTNLLALNAAIEAARAGAHGHGFAVVAEEVRKLAEGSQEAAKKIAELIGEIQGDTSKAVAAMNNGVQEVRTGTEVVNAAGVTFQEIVELVSQVSSQVREISAASQQMASGSQQIVVSVKKIDVLSKKSADGVQSISGATEEQLASMEEIATSSQSLAKLAQDLQSAVAGFRV